MKDEENLTKIEREKERERRRERGVQLAFQLHYGNCFLSLTQVNETN